MLTRSDELRGWLEARGFRTAKEPLRREGNEIDWYAYKCTEHEARECECNDGKPMQIVVKPFACTHHGETHESSTVELTGEAGGLWFTQQAYPLRHDELMLRMEDIERMLIRAWNALLPAVETAK